MVEDRKEEAEKQQCYESDSSFQPKWPECFPANRGAMLRAPDASVCTCTQWRGLGPKAAGFFAPVQIYDFSPVRNILHVFQPISQPQEFDFSPVAKRTGFI